MERAQRCLALFALAMAACLPLSARASLFLGESLWSARADGSANTGGVQELWWNGFGGLYLSSGGVSGPLITAPLVLDDGTYTFGFWASGSSRQDARDYYGLTISIDPFTANAHAISVYLPANSSCTSCAAAQAAVGENWGTTNGTDFVGSTQTVLGTTAELLSLSMFTPSVLDRVGPTSGVPDGQADFYGEFTLRVSSGATVDEPLGGMLLMLGLAGVALSRRRAKRDTPVLP